jgi:chromate transporter
MPPAPDAPREAGVTEPPASRPEPASQVPMREALAFWLKLGFISFGGPAGQIAIMHRELVERRRWISEGRFLHALHYCMLLPGPEAQQLATYLGWLMHRTRGGLIAGVLFVLPSLVLLILLSWIYLRFGHLPAVTAFFAGIRPAVAAIVLHAVWRLGSRVLPAPRRGPALWALALLAFVALAVFDWPFPAVLAAAALAGVLGARRVPQWFDLPAPGRDRASPAAPAVTAAQGEPGRPAAGSGALIDDDTPPPPHARASHWRLFPVLISGGALWFMPMAWIVAAQGWQSTLAQLGWFFTKAALLTFGGAYAVLPYVHQAAVDHFQWLTAAQMIDGLALGETTPGPLIMVVAFVGFVAGWTQQVLGPQAPVAGAVLAAVVATWFTFLPSFIFILAGGPWVESTRGRPGWAAPLAAISAAVVGVIASLGLFFVGLVARGAGTATAGATATAQGLAGLDLTALVLMACALLALVRGRLGVIPVILLSGLAGLLIHLL